MEKKRFRRYIEIFILCSMVIIFYKMFGSISTIFNGFLNLLQILKSFIYGAILAFLLNPIADRIEILLGRFKRMEKKKHFWAIMITFILLLIVLALIGSVLMPKLITTTIDFVNQLNDSKHMIIDYLDQYLGDYPDLHTKAVDYVKNIDLMEYISKFNTSQIAGTAIASVTEAFDILIGIVLCPYFLYEKENLLTIFYNILELFCKDRVIEIVREYVNASCIIFYNFIYGKAIDSLIIGIIALVFYLVFGFKFAILYGIVIGVTNMIPYFGPFIGGIPVTVVVFLTQGLFSAVVCGIFVFVLQQFDGLWLGPHILGAQIGVRPFWIVFSITLFGGLFGVIGMLIGVPLIAILGMMLNDLVRYNKRKRKELALEENSSTE